METKSVISFMFILQAIINGGKLVKAQGFPEKDRYVCRGGDFKSNTIKQNRDLALNKLLVLHKNSSFDGFYHTKVGNKPEEQVSASFMCPLNIQKRSCECCFNYLVQHLLESCPKENEGVAWDTYSFLYCMLRYSTGRKIFGVLDDWAWFHSKRSDNVQAVDLVKTMDSFTNKLKQEAAGGNALRKYAQGTVIYDGDENALTVIAQCTPDLSKTDCLKCLSKASIRIRSCCTEKSLFEGRIYSTNCILWYSHASFLDPPIVTDPKYCD